AGVDADAVANLAFRVNNDVREEASVVANLAIVSNVIAGHEHGARAYAGSRTDYTVRADMRRGINLRRGVDVCAWMNTGGVLIRRKKERQNFGDGHAGVRHANKRFF